jgi:hypothetical protein
MPSHDNHPYHFIPIFPRVITLLFLMTYVPHMTNYF